VKEENQRWSDFQVFKGLPIKYTFSDLKALEDLKEAVNQNRDSNIDILSLEHLGTF